jgi:hypothetical protein
MSEALTRLGVKTRPTKIERDYNAGLTTQVPSGQLIGVNRRVRRKLGYNGTIMRFERVYPDHIRDLAAQLQTNEQYIEEDGHVVRALGVIAALKTDGVTPVFSGCTSLAKTI